MQSGFAGSSGPNARFAGIIYLVYFATAVGGELFLRGIVLSGNADLTAANLLAHETRFQMGVGTGLVSTLAYLGLTGLFYRLFAPVGRHISATAAFFSIVGCAILAIATLFRVSPLAFLGDRTYLREFSIDQLHAFALLSFEVYGRCIHISFVFFGVYCSLIGYLIYQSTFLPRLIGAWMMLTGLSWLIFLFPPLAHSLHAYIVANGFSCEVVLMLWLILMGVDESRWHLAVESSGRT
jgi:hypothetical protein